MKTRAFILIGGPGSGKGTQGSILGAILGFFHMSSGDMFRGLDKESDIGREVGGYMSRGELVPDDLTIRLFSHHLDGCVLRGELNPDTDVIVLDGIPRNDNQARILAESADLLGILYIDLTDEIMAERMSGRALKEDRPDDANPETVARRIEVYHASVEALLSAYPADKVIKIDGNQSPLKVHADITQKVIEIVEG